MSLFKKNSRFSSLVEDETKKEKREKNIETRPNNNEHSFKRNKDDSRGNYGSFKDDKTRREDARLKEEKVKEEKLKESLSLESFPPLTPIIPINISSSTKNYTSFSEKLQTVVIKSSSSPSVEEDTDYKNLMRGWTLIKSDINKNIVIKSKDNSSLELEKTDNEIAFEVFDTLVEVHEKSRDEYIEELCKEYPDLIEKYDLENNKGYGSKKHLQGIEKHGISMFHRKTFGICKKY